MVDSALQSLVPWFPLACCLSLYAVTGWVIVVTLNCPCSLSLGVVMGLVSAFLIRRAFVHHSTDR
jgi:multisubunit Na+/H+ antiporter MnhE subunit